MKKLLISLFLSISLTSAFAFSLDDALNTLEDNAKDSIKKEGKVSLNSLTDDLKTEANKKIAELEETINKKIESYDDKINLEIDRAVGDVRKHIDELEKIKNRAYSIINFVKIFLGILSFSTLLIVFFIWRAFKRINNLHRLMENVRSYKDIEKRVAALEGK